MAKKSGDAAAKPVVRAIVWTTEEWPLARFLKAKRAGFNPKSAEADDIVRIANSLRVFGPGRAFAARAEDDLLLDGHQSQSAFELLLSGQHRVKGKPFIWTPIQSVTMKIAHNMSDAVARAFIAALTHNRVETDHEKMAQLILDLHNRVEGKKSNDDVSDLLVSVDAIGLTPAEFADYVDLAQVGDPDRKGGGGGAPPSPGVPKLTLEFTDPELRDKVKRKLAENARSEKEPHGNVLARIVSEWSKAAKPEKPGPKKAASRAKP